MFRINLQIVLKISSILLLFIGFFIICAYNYDPDLGWHIQAGHYMIDHGIPVHDIFSYSAPTFEWINHEWLYSLFVSQLYTFGGELGLALVFAALWTTGTLLAARKYEPLILVAGGISLVAVVGIRPSLFALLFVLLERILEASLVISQRRKLFLSSIPVLFLVWANVHGSFPLGFFVMVLFSFFNKKTIPWYIILLSISATFVNPYGYKIYIEIIRTMTSSELNAYISEWKGYILPVTYFFTIIPLVGIFLAIEKKLVAKKYILPVILFVASISSMRFFLFFTASSLRYLEDTWIECKKHISQKFSLIPLGITYCFIILTIWVMGITHRVSAEIPYPAQHTTYLTEHTCPGNLFNFYDYGGYLIWKLPEQKIFIDGRMPTWRTSTENYMRDYIQAINDHTFRKQLFEKYSIHCVLFPHKASMLIAPLIQEGWTVEVDDGINVLLFKPEY